MNILNEVESEKNRIYSHLTTLTRKIVKTVRSEQISLFKFIQDKYVESRHANA